MVFPVITIIITEPPFLLPFFTVDDEIMKGHAVVEYYNRSCVANSLCDGCCGRDAGGLTRSRTIARTTDTCTAARLCAFASDGSSSPSEGTPSHRTCTCTCCANPTKITYYNILLFIATESGRENATMEILTFVCS